MPNNRTAQEELVRKTAQCQYNSNDYIDLGALFIRLLEKWYLIVGLALTGALIAGVLCFAVIEPRYQSTARIYVHNRKDAVLNVSDLQLSNYLTNDYQRIFDLWPVHEMMLQETGLNYDLEKLNKMLSVTNPSDTRILEISVTSTDPVEAQTMANAYASVAREYIALKMDTEMPSILEEATLPMNPISPKKTRDLIIGALGGMLIACAIVIIRFLVDDYIRTPKDVEDAVQLSVLGSVMLQSDKGEQAEYYRKSRRGT